MHLPQKKTTLHRSISNRWKHMYCLLILTLQLRQLVPSKRYTDYGNQYQIGNYGKQFVILTIFITTSVCYEPQVGILSINFVCEKISWKNFENTKMKFPNIFLIIFLILVGVYILIYCLQYFYIIF